MFDPNDVRAVHYIFTGKPEELTALRVFFKDGTARVFEGSELTDAHAVVKLAFPPPPGPGGLSDRPLKD
jgi:hypothetical protein